MRDRIEDLSAHARRGKLSETGLRQLAIALRASHEARLLHDAGCEFDRADSVLAGDDAIAQRVVNRVLFTRQRANRRNGRRFAQVVLASFAWTAAAAAAAPLLVSSEVIRETRPTLGARPLTAKPVALGANEALSNLAPDLAPTNGATETAAPANSTKNTPAPATPAIPRVARERASSEQSFAEANRLRRLGRTSQAIAQYLSLQANFPGTEEARNADLSLGLLRLQAGASSAALMHFRRYLEHNSSAQLVPEALYGQAQAMEALGQRAAALRTYASLLRRYPDSAYANTARAKLQKSP